MKKIAVIMAGGSGERFWPLSRKLRPKQFLKLFSDNSMIRETYLRLIPFIENEYIFVVAGQDFKEQVIQEIPELLEDNLIIEPMGRDTAAAIGLSAIYIDKRHPDSIMLICASDHLIAPNELFKDNILTAFDIAVKKSSIVTIGIQPNRPETSYGYIELGNQIAEHNRGFEVNRFREKPNLETAETFLQQTNFVWNSGMFIFKTETILTKLQLLMPKLYKGLKEIQEVIGQDNEWSILDNVFQSLDKISIDFGVMEKAENIVCIKADFGWDDVGSWSALSRLMPLDDKNNVIKAKVLSHNISNTTVLSDDETLFGIIGINGLVIVKNENTILICHKNDDQDIKKLLSKIKDDNSLLEFL